jgi:hypothetical protein
MHQQNGIRIGQKDMEYTTVNHNLPNISYMTNSNEILTVFEIDIPETTCV